MKCLRTCCKFLQQAEILDLPVSCRLVRQGHIPSHRRRCSWVSVSEVVPDPVEEDRVCTERNVVRVARIHSHYCCSVRNTPADQADIET